MFAQTVVGSVVDFVALIVSAACGMVVWNWFVPVIFPAAPNLTLALAIGLIFVLSLFTSKGQQYKIEELRNLRNNSDLVFANAFFNQLLNGIAKPVVILGMAWVVRYVAF